MTARFTDLLAAEWIKLWSLRSTPWAFLIGALAVVGINVNGSLADYTNYPGYPQGIKDFFVPMWSLRDAFTVESSMVLMLATGSIGALAVISEYGTGQIRTTFAAVPARRSVVAAKLSVVTVLMTLYGAVVAGTSFGVTQAILAGRGVGVSLGHPGALRVVVASALLAPVCALAGMGLGSVIRHTAGTIVAVTGFLLLLPSLFTDRDHWTATVLHALPHGAWDRLVEAEVANWPGPPAAYPSSIAGSWVVYAVWAVVAAVVAVVVIDVRDCD
ncbi:ABC transporter permease [Streptomyces sp. CB03234]|uniref:ABC transporter permease n=1 Tax=Streptomyces sp. (strain CB03234) TaxID=1703937 RepID=UPI00093B6E5E|nr:ABC transporter permease [Streptomyces sp. CB03234]OKJ96898.1 ABC transporter permease [Streptomyces sp. CB03234]